MARDRLLHGRRAGSLRCRARAVMRDIHRLASRLCSRKDFTILTDSQIAIERIQSDAPGPGQDTAIEIIEFASVLYEQGNTLTV